LIACTAAAQETDALRIAVPAYTVRADAVRADTVRAYRLPLQEGAAVEAATDGSGLEEPVQFAARDSLVLVFDRPAGDLGSLFGDARVTYDDATLGAYRVDILFGIDELRASGLAADTGMVGRPSFAQGSDAFQGDALAF